MTNKILITVYLSFAAAISPLFAADSPPQYSITERGVHYQVWDSVLPNNSHQSFIELQSGLNYEENGVWREAEESISAGLDGAEAIHGAHKVHFPANITAKPVEITMPDGAILKGKVFGLAYYDIATGKSVLIADIKDSVGQLLPSRNELIYQDAFTDISADIRYTYRKSGFEQDIVLRANPPAPSAWGLSDATSRLTVLTEFFDPPKNEVRRNSSSVAKTGDSNTPAVTDDFVDFGVMHIGSGKAFALSTAQGQETTPRIPIFKTWTEMSGRRFLLEEVNYRDAQPLLSKLPAVAVNKANKAQVVALAQLIKQPTSKASSEFEGKQISLAANDEFKSGLVLDYTLLSAATNFTFLGSTTYYVSGPVTLSGTNTTIESGTVVKFTNTSSAIITINSTTTTGPTNTYRPAVFTSKDDNNVGLSVTGSTGSPSGYYGGGLFFNTSPTLSNLRFCYLNQAFSLDNFQSLNLSDSQLVNTYVGIHCSLSNNVSVENVLFSLMDAVVERGPVVFAGTHITTDQISSFGNLATGGTNSALSLTNSLLWKTTTLGFLNRTTNTVTEDHDADVTTFTGPPFQVMGGGSHYLAYNSPFRDAGTTNISPALLARLSQKTTYAPVVYPRNYLFSTNTVLGRVVPRDDDTPDLGYHYDALDFCFSNASLTNSTLTITNGAAVAFYGVNGLNIQTGGKVVSQGDASHMNHLVRNTTVQEGPATWGTNSATMVFFATPSATTSAQVTLRFTDVSYLAAGQTTTEFIYMSGVTGASFSAMDCSFRGAYIYQYAGPTATTSIALTNNFFRDSKTEIFLGYAGSAFPNASGYFFNNTYQNGAFALYYAGGPCMASDNFLDNATTSVTQIQTVPGSKNAFKGPITAFGANPVNITIDDFQPGPLGSFYYPTTGVSGGLTNLIDKGSRTASAAGLSSYTTTTNQVTDGSSTVDIGFHYFGLNTNAVVTIFADSPLATEDSVLDGEFTVTRTGSTSSALNVVYNIGGLAINGTDYATISSMVTIPSGSSFATIPVNPITDTLVEFNETVVLSLIQTNSYMLGAQTTATVTIQDDDVPSLTTITNLNNPAGIDFQTTSGKYIISWNTGPLDNGSPNNFATMTSGGALAPFSGIAGLPGEVKLVTVKSTAHGFTNGDVYFSGAGPGEIGWVSADGTRSNLTWVTIAGETNAMRGALIFDPTGIYGGDLLAVSGGTAAVPGDNNPFGGTVYRITSAGSVTPLGQITNRDGRWPFVESLLVMTNDFSRYGPWAGNIIGGAEISDFIYSLNSTAGSEQIEWNFSLVPEDIDVIVPGKNWYLPIFGQNDIVKANSSVFTAFAGDLAIVQELTSSAIHSSLVIAHWTGGYFIMRELFPSGATYEHANFDP